MTTTVTVKARAWGAKVTKGDESFDLDAHEDRTFQLDEAEQLTVAHGEKPAEVPEPSVTENTSKAAPAGGLGRPGTKPLEDAVRA